MWKQAPGGGGLYLLWFVAISWTFLNNLIPIVSVVVAVLLSVSLVYRHTGLRRFSEIQDLGGPFWCVRLAWLVHPEDVLRIFFRRLLKIVLSIGTVRCLKWFKKAANSLVHLSTIYRYVMIHIVLDNRIKTILLKLDSSSTTPSIHRWCFMSKVPGQVRGGHARDQCGHAWISHEWSGQPEKAGQLGRFLPTHEK